MWTMAGAAVLSVATVACTSRPDGDGSDAADPAPLAVGVAGTLPRASTSTSGPLPSTTTITTSPTTTASQLVTTTTSPVQTTESGYVWIPKPQMGPGTIASGGALTKHLADDIAAAFGLDTADVQAAIAALELPPEAGGNPEGWLAPGAYEPAVGADALEILQAMVDRRVAQLEERGIPRDEWHRVLTAASVVEKETYNQNEKPNVASVLANRLAGGGPLQMDSIILYPVPEDRIFTTSEERVSDQPYNSYRHNGLPPTPICSPDETSIDAFLNPPPSEWWFYVTIDLHSGETRYAVTYEEHLTNVELLRAWLEDHPTP